MPVVPLISDANAESIGRPVFDQIIHSFLNEDREEFIQHFPYLDTWMTTEIFDEAVVVLNRLGKLLSSEYSGRSMQNDKHVLTWNVRYDNDDNTVVWDVFLKENQTGIKLNGFRFDR